MDSAPAQAARNHTLYSSPPPRGLDLKVALQNIVVALAIHTAPGRTSNYKLEDFSRPRASDLQATLSHKCFRGWNLEDHSG
jgi:hypothetical protein